jgi:N-methylhydantoinase A
MTTEESESGSESEGEGESKVRDDLRVGVDIGGTFTDVVTIRNGAIETHKTPSTPQSPEQGVLDGLREARERGDENENEAWRYDAISFLGHGTTVATNAVLEEAWADTALVTTEGFGDVLEIGRQDRPDIYDFQAEKATPIVPRDRRYEVTERLDERGAVLTDLDESSVRAVADRLREENAESVAVCLLYAFENTDHERRVRELLTEAGVEASVSLSSDVLPEIREYERTLVTAMNAALKPVMEGYIATLGTEIADAGVSSELRIMQSNGGIIDADVARNRPVRTLLSGPAAGVQGATAIAERCGSTDVVTMDMGGTSCDVSLVENAEPVVSTDVEVGPYPIGVPMIDVHTVGSGGGSIAWIDAGDALRVGPRSAGADPGPICYGRDGTEPTITEAQLLLGRLTPSTFLGDEDAADIETVRRVTDEAIAGPLGRSVEEAAQDVVDVANANLQRALRVVSVERGHDPREFGLVAFGGAGPLHAPELAAELDIPRVIIPRTAGVLSALGLLVSDVLYDYSTSRLRRLDAIDTAELEVTFGEFEGEGHERLADEGFAAEETSFERTLDLRYVGQAFELSVPVPDGEIGEAAIETVEDRFHERHRQRYGHAYGDEPIELVTVRLRARGAVDAPTLGVEEREAAGAGSGSVENAIRETREVIYDGRGYETRIYDGTRLPVGGTFDGPAVIEAAESTTVVPPDQRVRVDDFGNLLIEVFPDE